MRCERNENTSISSGVTDTSDNFRSCNPGVFDGGATYRLELQCYHLAGKSERYNMTMRKTVGGVYTNYTVESAMSIQSLLSNKQIVL